MSKENGKGRQTGQAPAGTGSDKPGERVPPAAVRVSSLKAAPEAEKKPGVGGVPSPVGDNDLA